jgi:poly-gamma-glutamate synthase PgsB/CapB
MPLAPLIILGSIVSLFLVAGWLEYRLHQSVLAAIPLRIHVNGTRGKSSVTRLIAAGLRAGGLRTFAKTTGTAPRVIDTSGKDRIIHRLRSPSIGEQVRLLHFFAREKPDAVVMECMAVQPQYQWISEQQMIRAQIGVITNVRPDHIEEMGPTMEDITRSLANTIPRRGTLITAEKAMLPLLEEVARQRHSDCIFVEEGTVSAEELEQFAYLEHPQNVALALEVCQRAGVDRDIALRGMTAVQPDLGALVTWRLAFNGKEVTFINGMAANDPVSTLHIWYYSVDRYPSEGETCVFLNTRKDRRIRTRQLLQLALENIKPDRLVIRADQVENQVRRLQHYSPATVIQIVGMEEPLQRVIEHFQQLPHDSLIFAIGNQVGEGQAILEAIRAYRIHG